MLSKLVQERWKYIPSRDENEDADGAQVMTTPVAAEIATIATTTAKATVTTIATTTATTAEPNHASGAAP